MLSAGLSRYIYISIHPYFYPDKTICKYSSNEIVDNPSELTHPIFRTLLERFSLNGVEIVSTADIPSGAGLGSSSSFTIGLLHSLYAYTGKYVSQRQLAEEACFTEIDVLGEPIGKQDQYAAAYGGLNMYHFNKDGYVDVQPVIMTSDAADRMEKNLLMFFTGELRAASAILEEQRRNIIGDDVEKEKAQIEISKMTMELYKELINDNIDSLGPIMHAGWELKRQLARGITNPTIDHAYEAAMKAGACGGKLLGAGGGGFLIFYVPEHRHNAVKNALSHLRYMEFGFSHSGSSIVFIGEKPKGI